MKHVYRAGLYLLCCVLSVCELYAQTPELINYQAVARNSETGEELANQEVFLSAKILANGPNGEIVYQENHSDVSTNTFGLFNIQIGGGSVVSGNFANIDWESGSHWLEIDMDIGNGLETVGAMQFVSVPYALHAKQADLATTAINVDDADADPSNELIDSFDFDIEGSMLSINEGSVVHMVDLDTLRNDADSDPNNERILDFSYNPDDAVLSINEAGSISTADLSALSDDDPDPTNEAITSAVLQNSILTITEGNEVTEQSWSVGLEQLIDDADADPSNELISANGLALDGDTMLQVTEAGTTHELDLSALRSDEDWKISDDQDVVFNETARVAVGTDSPTTSFFVNGSVGYGVTLIESAISAVEYDIMDGEYLIVCKVSLGHFAPIILNMPDPSTCPGRILTIRKTGNIPIMSEVTFDFDGAQVDFIDQNLELDDVIRTESISFLSLGADGWTELSKN